jgi:hypothetical protein
MSKIVMTDKELSSWRGATILNITSEYCERTKQDFGKLFMDEKYPTVLDVSITVNGHEMDVDSFFRDLEGQLNREIAEKAKRLLMDVMFRAAGEMTKAIKIETEE